MCLGSAAERRNGSSVRRARGCPQTGRSGTGTGTGTEFRDTPQCLQLAMPESVGEVDPPCQILTRLFEYISSVLSIGCRCAGHTMSIIPCIVVSSWLLLYGSAKL